MREHSADGGFGRTLVGKKTLLLGSSNAVLPPHIRCQNGAGRSGGAKKGEEIKRNAGTRLGPQKTHVQSDAKTS